MYRLFILSLVLTLTACGGGGSESAIAVTPETPTSVTASITSSGGVLKLGAQDIATVAEGTVTSTATFAVSLTPTTDPQALALSDIKVTLPLSVMRAASTAGITVYFYPDGKVAALAARPNLASGLPAGLGSDLLHARVSMTTPSTTSIIGQSIAEQIVPVVWNSVRLAYEVRLLPEHIAEYLIANTVVISINLYMAKVETSTSTATKLYHWDSSSWISTLPADYGDLVPLVLVHGIVAKLPFGSCGTNTQYEEAWKVFASRFFKDSELPSKYSLYSFQYPTNVSIKENGRQLAIALKNQFGNKPVVILSHSMGGLVTRAADLYSNQSPSPSGWEALSGINIQGVITLDTPHLGTPWIANTAQRLQQACWGDALSEGARDLQWWSKKNSDEHCDNDFLCNSKSGLNKSLVHLGKYVPYSGKFDIPESDWLILAANPSIGLIAAPSIKIDFNKHGLYVLARLAQQFGQDLKVVKSLFKGIVGTSSGDGMVLVSSQRLQTWNETEWTDSSPSVFADVPATYDDIDHSSIHDSEMVFSKKADGSAGGIRMHLLDIWKGGVQSMKPTLAEVTVPTTFTVVAKYFPVTAKIEMTDAVCQNPTEVSTAGFKVVCTPSKPGVKKLSISDLASGKIIDDSQTISISCPVNQAALNGECVTATGFTLSGKVSDELYVPLNGALISITVNGFKYQTAADALGAYTLHLDVGPSSLLPSFFVVSASEGISHNPESITLSLSDGNLRTLNFVLSTVANTPQLVVIELVPDVHHLGDGNFSGSTNSQFQYPKAEGTYFSRNFQVTARQKLYSSATLTFKAKGVQLNHDTVTINGSSWSLSDSDALGNYTTYSITIDMSSLFQGINTFAITSGQPSTTDYDDFEFTDARINFK